MATSIHKSEAFTFRRSKLITILFDDLANELSFSLVPLMIETASSTSYVSNYPEALITPHVA